MLDLNPTERIMGWMGQTTKYSDSQKDLWNKEERKYHANNEFAKLIKKLISAIILNLTTILVKKII